MFFNLQQKMPAFYPKNKTLQVLQLPRFSVSLASLHLCVKAISTFCRIPTGNNEFFASPIIFMYIPILLFNIMFLAEFTDDPFY